MAMTADRIETPVPGLDLSARGLWRHPLPHMERSVLDRFLIRTLMLGLRRYLVDVKGLERIAPRHDPFVLAPNHNQKLEAILLPVLLIFHRGGKRIHFLSDWNFRMIPGLALVLRRAGTIILMNKSARPRFLNVFKPWFDPGVPGWVRARQKLEEGASVGVYVEGTVNRDPRHLLRGYSGASRLSLTTQAPVVPVGITFPGLPRDRRVPEWEPMAIEIGEPMAPPACEGEPTLADVSQWHQQIMLAIARLSGKEWQPNTRRR
jgi:1-acyl-sn-glycerol-3-phosphate acyltransferase